MSSPTSWTVSYFTVNTSTQDEKTDRLYANGRMQVPVDALIQAVDDQNNTYQLTQEELDSIKLVQYHSPTDEVSGKWSYSDQENHYDHVLPFSQLKAAPSELRRDDTKQTKRYWVSTEEVENQQNAASIALPSGEAVTIHNDTYDSHVTLTSIAPNFYTLNDIDVEKTVTDDGDWYETHGDDDTVYQWDQDKYYVC